MEKAIGERFACTSNQETAENDDDEKKGIQRGKLPIKRVISPFGGCAA